MKSPLAKVMHEVCGRPMLAAVVDACRDAAVARIVIVVGYDKQSVIDGFAGQPDLTFVEQVEQKGTGHAVQMAEPALANWGGDVVVIAGDMPLVRGETLRELLVARQHENAAAAIATTVLSDPSGYGRILRDERGEFRGIIEDRDCTDAQRRICEVNPSYYCFQRPLLFDALREIRPNNAKNEYYITDALAILLKKGQRIIAKTQVPAEDATGINSRADLAEVSRLMQRRIQRKAMESGVTIVAPELTWIESGSEFGAETVLQPFTFIGRAARIGARCRIGPMAVIARGEQVSDGRAIAGNLAAADAMHSGPVDRLARMAMASHGRGA